MEVEPAANDIISGGAADGTLLDELSSTLDKISKRSYDSNLRALDVALSQQLGIEIKSALLENAQSVLCFAWGWLAG